MSNLAQFKKDVRKATAVYAGTQILEGDPAYVQVVKADVYFAIEHYPEDARINYAMRDDNCVYIN